MKALLSPMGYQLFSYFHSLTESRKICQILFETSFISNKTDEKRLKDQDYQDALAEGIVKGIQRYSEEKVASLK